MHNIEVETSQHILTYQKMILDQASHYIDSTRPESDSELREAIDDVIFNRDGPRTFENQKVTKEIEYFMEYFFRPYSELFSALEELKIASKYINSVIRKKWAFRKKNT